MKLKETIYSTLCLIVTAGLFAGCIDEYEADIADEDSNLLVVEGTILSGEINTFTLSRTQSLSSGYTTNMVYGAKVSVCGSDGSEVVATIPDYSGYYTMEYMAYPGRYVCQMGELNPEVEYYLRIEVDDEVYESEHQKPLATEKIADIRGVQDTPTSPISVLVTPAEPADKSNGHYYSWTYDETWELRPYYVTNLHYDIQNRQPVEIPDLYPLRGWKDGSGSSIMIGSSTNYEGQHIQRLKLYDVGRNDERIYHRYSGLVYQRAISKAEYEYELARRQASSGMGGLFTPQPSALPSNIHCLTSKKHVIGYVGCSLNTSKYRFFLNQADYSAGRPIFNDWRLWIENPTYEQCCDMIRKGWDLCEWLEPGSPADGPLKSAWAMKYQLDVRLRGAYIEKPDYWDSTENISY